MSSGSIQYAESGGTYILKLVGDVRLTLCITLENFLEKMFADTNFRSVIIDLVDTQGIDSTSLGMLAKLSIQAQKKFDLKPTIVSTNADINRILLSMGFDEVFIIVDEPSEQAIELQEVACKDCDEDRAKEWVLDAHRTLMQLNEKNRLAFKDLVKVLEADS